MAAKEDSARSNVRKVAPESAIVQRADAESTALPLPEPEPLRPLLESPPAPCPSRLMQFWQATIGGTVLAGQLERDLHRLEPVSWEDGVLVLRASAGDVARRCRRMAELLVHELRDHAPVPLETIAVTGSETHHNSLGMLEEERVVSVHLR